MKSRVIGPSTHKSIFKFASPKMGKMVKVESSLEYDACFHFEYSPSITSFITQPCGVDYQLNGRTQTFYPDFLVEDKEFGKRFFEIKPSSKVRKPEFRAKFALRRDAALSQSIPLIVVTEKQICLNPILNNLKLLHRYAGNYSLTPLHFWVLDAVKSLGRITVRDLVDESECAPGDVFASALTWISRGQLQADISDNELGVNSLVWC